MSLLIFFLSRSGALRLNYIERFSFGFLKLQTTNRARLHLASEIT